MLKRRNIFTFYFVIIPSFFVVEGFDYIRFKTKSELKQEIVFYYKKLLALFKNNNINTKACNWAGLSTKSLSSFDYQINEKGGIVDCNGNVHTTANSYKNFLKANDLVIKDWSDGSNKPKQQLSDRAEIAKIVNKYI